MLRLSRRSRWIALASSALVALVVASGCEGTMSLEGVPAGSGGDRWEGPRPVCPMDPDRNIGGDCSLYECPDHWECQPTSDAGAQCASPGPDYPDDDGNWACRDESGATVCSRGGGDVPAGAGGDGWSCERSMGESVVCRDGSPSYPADYPGLPGDGPWSCRFDEGLRVCTRGPGSTPAGNPPVGSDTPGVPSAPPPAPGGPPGDLPPAGSPPVSRECDRGDASCDVAVCSSGGRSTATFSDDRDGANDGEIVVFSDRSPDVSCATVTVPTTGWYRIHDRALAESCGQQRDETAFITITNSCRAEGQPLEHNSGNRFVWQDMDNQACDGDSDCGAGLACLAPRHGSSTCCSPSSPVFMGTFLLRAGEANRLCLHHWCPVWQSEGRDGGFVHNDCDDSMNSVHFRLDDSAIVCGEDLSVPAECR